MFEPDYFEHKRRQLGMDRVDILGSIQQTLDSWFPGQTRVVKLHRGVLRIITPNSSVASDLRLRQIELIKIHSSEQDGHPIQRLQISIATLH